MPYKYKRVNNTHLRTNSRGYVYEHMLVAEQMLGRKLLQGETVHHKDENKSNNAVNNIMIFSTNEDHSRFHSGVYSKLVESNGVWKCLKIEIRCPNCKKLFYKRNSDQKYCSLNCSELSHRKVIRPDKITLTKLLKEHTFMHTGKLYNVSDNTIRKWCVSYEISPKAKYWRGREKVSQKAHNLQ